MPTVICAHCSEVISVTGPKPEQCPSCGRTLQIDGDFTHTGPQFGSTTLHMVERQRTTIGRYVVQSKLGAGGFGSVFLAQDPQLDRLVAIKVPRDDTGSTPIALERFAREGRNVAQLRHPGIVSVFNVELDGELPYIVCEYVEGQTLSDRLRRSPLSFSEAARLVAEVASAVHYAHECGIIHRDIKPSNIMISSDGKPRLMDFGLAKREAIDVTVTADHAIVGTPAYMSPEQAWGGKRRAVDRRSDVYSLGTVLYHLLTREIPFHGEPRMVLRQVIQDDPKNPRSLNGDVPRDLETICEKAMQKDPAGRYQTAGALADDLNRWLRGEPIQARPVTRLERAWRWCRRNPITAGLVATIAVLLATIACSATVMFAKERRHRMTLEEALLENNRLLSKAYVERANRSMDPLGPVDEYSPLKGLPWLLAAEQIDEKDPARREASRLRLGAALKLVPSVERLWVHPGTIGVAASSSTGDWFFTGGTDGTGRIWKYSSDEPQGRALTHPAGITAAEFSPDNKLLLTGCADGSSRLWDTASGQLVAGPLVNGNFAQGIPAPTPLDPICFSRSGRFFATYARQTVLIWETANHRPVGQPIALRSRPTSLAFAHADALLVVPCFDGSIGLWDVQTGKQKDRFQVTPRAPALAAVSPDGTILAGMDSPQTVAQWDCATGKKLERPPLAHSDKIKSARFSRDGRFLAVGTDDGTVILWQARDSRQVWKRRVSMKEVVDLRFANHGPELAVETRIEHGNRRFTVLDVENGELIAEPIALPGVIRSQDWVGQADALATSSSDGTVRLWRTESDEGAFALLHSADVASTALTADRRILATIDEEGVYCLARLPSDQETSPNMIGFPTNMTQPAAAALSADGKLLAIADSKTSVVIFEFPTRKILARMESSAPVLKMAFTTDGGHLITVTRKGHVTAWNPATGERTQHQQLDLKDNARFATIQGRLCAIVAAKQILVRDALDPSWTGSVLNHDKVVNECCLSPDGNLILSGCSDGMTRVWARSTGKVAGTTARFSQAILSVAFSPDGSQFATAAHNGTMRIWRTVDALPLTGTFSHGSLVSSGLLYSPDGRYLISTSGNPASGTTDGLVRVWDASRGEAVCSWLVTRLSGRFPFSGERREPWRLAATFFSADGKMLHFVTTGGILGGLDLRADTRSMQDFQREVGLRSGMQVDATGDVLFMEADQVRSMWHLPARSPDVRNVP